MADATSHVLPPLVSSVGAVTVALIGVEPQTLFLAFCGSTLGLVLSVSIGRWKAIAVFPFVTIVAAELATWAALAAFDGSSVARNGLAALIGMFAHPLISAGVRQIDPLVAGIADKLGARR